MYNWQDFLEIEENSSKPIYQQVTDGISSLILSGKWEPGEKIPSEEEIITKLKISRGTLRKSLDILVEQGLLTKSQGKGTFVSKPKISYPFAQELISFAETMDRKGLAYETNVIEQKIIYPDQNMQKKLQISKEDKVLQLKRIRSIEKEPAILLENWVAIKYFPGIEKMDFKENSLFKAMEELMKEKIVYGVRNFSAVSLSRGQALFLELEEKAPILKIEQLVFGPGEVPIEFSNTLLRTDKYQVTSMLPR